MSAASDPTDPDGQGRLTALYDADCGFCARTALLVHRLDSAERLRFVPLQRGAYTVPGAPAIDELAASMHIRDADGRWWAGGEAWLRIMDQVPMLRPLSRIGRLPLMDRLVEPVYRRIADNRHLLSRMLGARACRYRPPTSAEVAARP